MGALYYNSSDAQTRKLWSKRLMKEALRESPWAWFMGEMSEDPDSVICLKKESSAGIGDTVTVSLQKQLTGDGVQGRTPLIGAEEALVEYTQAVNLNEIRHGSEIEITGMSAQRVQYDQDPKVRLKNQLKDWWTELFSVSLANVATGNTSTSLTPTGTIRTLNNTPVVYDTNHIIWSGGAANTESQNSSSYIFTLADIDKCVFKATTLNMTDGTGYPIKKAKIRGLGRGYVMLLSPHQVYDLRAGTAAGTWQDITKYAQMGKGETGPLYAGAEGEFRFIGKYNGTFLFEEPRMPKGQRSDTTAYVSNTRRAVFMGAGAISAAFGRGYEEGQMMWKEETKDYDKWLGVGSGCILGGVKTRFNSLDYATIVVSSYTTLA